jgi:hypothetical protein
VSKQNALEFKEVRQAKEASTNLKVRRQVKKTKHSRQVSFSQNSMISSVDYQDCLSKRTA